MKSMDRKLHLCGNLSTRKAQFIFVWKSFWNFQETRRSQVMRKVLLTSYSAFLPWHDMSQLEISKLINDNNNNKGKRFFPVWEYLLRRKTLFHCFIIRLVPLIRNLSSSFNIKFQLDNYKIAWNISESQWL